MRLVICWSAITGYTAACWRALAAKPGVELRVVAGRGYPGADFDADLVDGLDCHLLDAPQLRDAAHVASRVTPFKPDVVFISGWGQRGFTALVDHPDLRQAQFMTGMDNQRLDTWRQWVGRFVLRRFLGRMQRVFVAGERAWQYGRYLGVPESKLVRAYLGIDYHAFAPLYEQRLARPDGWPRRFLFLGSYVNATKALDVLAAGYRRYRTMVDEPWPLTCCGTGPDRGELAGIEGVDDRGFVQPRDLGPVFLDAGAFVLPSRCDAWAVVIPESMAAGLPVLCTNTPGAVVECVRPYWNGRIVPTGDADALAQGMQWMHAHWSDLPAMGSRARALAAGFSADVWADVWHETLTQVCRVV